MRALVFNDQGLRLEQNYPDPTLQPGEAIIRTTRAGICSTDLEICKGYMNFQGVLGHEFVGIVEAVHDSCHERYKTLVGQRVVGGINAVCGKCDMCTSGLSTHCRDRTVLGIAGRDGCFAERFSLPAVNLLPVVDGLDDDHAVFTEPLAAACAIPQQLHIEGKPYITILGDGRLGLLTAQVMSRLNATVRLLGKHPQKLAVCEKLGIKHRPVSEVIPRADQDVIVDCTGSAQGLELAMQMVRPRGKIVLKTTVADQAGVDLSPLVINEIQLLGSRCGPFPEALNLLINEEVQVLPMITRRFKLNDAPQAMVTAQQKDSIKILLEFD